METYHSFRPGHVWLDTDGKRIQAHGGSIMFVDGTYYWYGENKEKMDGTNNIWHWGMKIYSSADLYNWKDEGYIIKPEPMDESSHFHPTVCLDRPHIIFNRKSGKYVCWIKEMHKDTTQSYLVLTADKITGSYQVVKENLYPMQMSGGDFDLVVAPDGKAYIYFERVHSELICADLNEEYTDVTGYYTTHFPRLYPPYVREAPAHFFRKGTHYLITSGTTGYFPNPSEAASANTWHGPFHVLGNPHKNDDSHTSFHSQISSVFKVPGKKDLYIACADRWLPNLMELKYEEYAKQYEDYFNPETDTDTISDNTDCQGCIADYVWLPLKFEEDRVVIEWMDEWRLEDYE
ncbi:family 43 glycosylhydrolase [Ruminococcus sp. 5_1_39BFAA]|uniref:family 43 glycosylhydrolase n=1 Tax=Ruminococcus sp. 5_1_39BFAA TaxID=457412 RepID=UPI0035615FAC